MMEIVRQLRDSQRIDLKARIGIPTGPVIEVDKLIEAAKANRHGHRDALKVLLAYRHGLRAAEVVDLRWGSRSISKPLSCTYVGSGTAHLLRIP
jgi:integrase